MTTAELHIRIHCWLWLYDRMSLTPLNNEMIFKNSRFILIIPKHELMEDVSRLQIPSDLYNSSVADRLRLAIDYGNTGDYSRLFYIAELLRKVNQEITKRPIDRDTVAIN